MDLLDWPSDFIPGMSKNCDYDKLDMPEFFAGFLAMIKPHDNALKSSMFLHLEIVATKAISHSWRSVRSFHANVVSFMAVCIYFAKVCKVEHSV